jgi:hypothetical protein
MIVVTDKLLVTSPGYVMAFDVDHTQVPFYTPCCTLLLDTSRVRGSVLQSQDCVSRTTAITTYS